MSMQRSAAGWFLLVLALTASVATRIDAAAPSNDTCAGAEVIPAAGPFPHMSIPVNVSEATTTGDPAFVNCAGPLRGGVWYTFTPAATAVYTLSTAASQPTATTVDRTIVAVFTSSNGCAGTFTILPTVLGETDGCSFGASYSEQFQATLPTTLTAGTTYFIGVWVVGGLTPLNPMTSTVQLRVEKNDSIPNDNCSNVTTLTVNRPTYGTTKGATNDYVLSNFACFTGSDQTSTSAEGRDTVYSFTAGSDGLYEFKVVGAITNTDMTLYLSSSCPAAQAQNAVVVPCAGASNHSDIAGERVLITLNAGDTRYAFVDADGFAGTNIGFDYFIQVTPIALETEPNGTPATASTLRCGGGFDIGSDTDVDFVSLGSFADQSRVFAFVDGTPVPSFPIAMRLTTTTDTLEYDQNAASAPFNDSCPVIAGAILSATPNYLRIGRDEADRTLEGYRLYTVVQPALASATAEVESNDTTGTSSAATNNYFTGTLSGPAPSADIDFYRTPAGAGDTIFVALDGDPLRNNTPVVAKIALLDPDGHVLVQVNEPASTSSTSSGAGSLTATTPFSPAQALVFQAPSTGTYFVRVEIGTTSTGATGSGDYLLSIAVKDARDLNCVSGNGTATIVGFDTVSPPAGVTSGGQQITLAGRFTSVSAVTVGGTSAVINNNTGSLLTLTTPAHSSGAAAVALTAASGSFSKSNGFAYLNTAFTDSPLVASTTPAKAQHLIELRAAIDALRLVAGLSAASWTDPTLSASTSIQAIHINELRTYLEDAAARLGFAAGTYTDPSLTIGTTIKREHIDDLRAQIEDIAG